MRCSMKLQTCPVGAWANREIPRELNDISAHRAAGSSGQVVQVGKEAFSSASFSLHGRKKNMQKLCDTLDIVLLALCRRKGHFMFFSSYSLVIPLMEKNKSFVIHWKKAETSLRFIYITVYNS